jgi:hypothetical protein
LGVRTLDFLQTGSGLATIPLTKWEFWSPWWRIEDHLVTVCFVLPGDCSDDLTRDSNLRVSAGGQIDVETWK